MSDQKKNKGKIFDEWPDQYDRWFETPIGALVKKYESELLLDLLRPGPGEMILDAGCGTGIFTHDILREGSAVIGLDISWPMLVRAGRKTAGYQFKGIIGDMMSLPFAYGIFDKVVSVTALEFLENDRDAVKELFRVTRKGGIIVVATLNNLSPWAVKRKQAATEGHSLFRDVIFRSPDDMRLIGPSDCEVKTAVHFQKDDDPETAIEIEHDGRKNELQTGAFLVAGWEKR